jgi:hypothetical protein
VAGQDLLPGYHKLPAGPERNPTAVSTWIVGHDLLLRTYVVGGT